MSDSVFKSISFTLISNLWLTFATLVCTPLYIKFLGIESYGLIGFYITILAIVGVIDSGFSSAAAREIASMNANDSMRLKIKDLFFSLEVVYWPIISLVALIFLYLLNYGNNSWVAGESLNPSLISETISLILLLTFFQVPIGLYMNGLIGFQKHITFSILNSFFGTIRTFGVLPLLYFYEDIRIFFLWQIAWAILQVLASKSILFFNLKKISTIRSKFSIASLIKIKNYLGGMFLVTVLSLIVSQIDKVILSKILSLEDFAYYMLAFTVALSLSRLTTPIIQVFWPKFSSLNQDHQIKELRAKFFECFEILSAAIIPIAIIIFLYSEPLLFLWTNDIQVTANTKSLLMVLIIGTTFSALSFPALIVLYAKGILMYVIKVNFVSLMIIGPSLLIFTSMYGSIAAAFLIALFGILMLTLFNYKAFVILEISSKFFFFKKFFYPVALSIFISSLFYFVIISLKARLAIFLTFGLLLLITYASIIFFNKKFKEAIMHSEPMQRFIASLYK